jgi:hypothetical protein
VLLTAEKIKAKNEKYSCCTFFEESATQINIG